MYLNGFFNFLIVAIIATTHSQLLGAGINPRDYWIMKKAVTYEFVCTCCKDESTANESLVKATLAKTENPIDGGQEPKKVKICQLPIYGTADREFTILPEDIGLLRKGVSTVRQQVWEWSDATQESRERITHIYETGKAHSQSSIDYIKNEPSMLPRVGVVALSGLGGVVLGYRGGVLRKSAYSSLAMLTTGALVFSNELNNKYSVAEYIRDFWKKKEKPSGGDS